MALLTIGPAITGSTAPGAPPAMPALAAPHARLRDALWENGRLRERAAINYEQLVQSLPEMEALVERLGPWARVSAGDDPANTVYPRHDLATGLFYASLLAPDPQEGKKWGLKAQALEVRLFRDPYSQRLWAEYRPGTREPRDLQLLFRAVADFPSLRIYLKNKGYIGSDDWGILQGLTWINQPEAVVVRHGVAFADQRLLQAAGLPLQGGAFQVTAVNGKRRANIPVGDPSAASARRGFRTADGRVYIPVEELQRQGVYTVDVDTQAQMVRISTDLPQS